MSDDSVKMRRNKIHHIQDQYRKYQEYLDRLDAQGVQPKQAEKTAFQADPAKAGVESTRPLSLKDQAQIQQTDHIARTNPKVGDQREDGTRFTQKTAGLSAGLNQDHAGVGLRQPRSNPAAKRGPKPNAQALEARYEVAIDDNEEGLDRVKNPATSGAVEAMGEAETDAKNVAANSSIQHERESQSETINPAEVNPEQELPLDPERTRVDVTQEELGNPESWYINEFAPGVEVAQGEVEFEDKEKTATMSKQDMASPTEATVQVKRDEIREDKE